MQQRKMVIANSIGLHARPAALMTQAAKKFSAKIQLQKGDKKANAKSITEIMLLAVKSGEEVVIIAEGNDEKEAIEYIEQLVENKFGEA